VKSLANGTVEFVRDWGQFSWKIKERNCALFFVNILNYIKI